MMYIAHKYFYWTTIALEQTMVCCLFSQIYKLRMVPNF